MRGLKKVLFGILLVLIAAGCAIDPGTNLGGWGELGLYAAGLGFGVAGLADKQ